MCGVRARQRRVTVFANEIFARRRSDVSLLWLTSGDRVCGQFSYTDSCSRLGVPVEAAASEVLLERIPTLYKTNTRAGRTCT